MGKKILLVEDNEMNRDMLSRRLLKKGYDILIAEDGAQGVQMAQVESPDLILMDLSLPVMDGWEATRQIKGSSDTQRIPVIALTAHAMSGDRERALAAGCDDYDTKPVDIKRLLPKIEALLAAPAQSAPPKSGSAAKGSLTLPETKVTTPPEETKAQVSLLVVDDNEMNRDMLSRRLVKQGYNVTIATGGQDALTLVENESFDLILLDVMMPDVSGLDVLQRIRESHTSSQLPIIMVTAKDESEDVVRALELGANDYVTKPVDFPVALARIKAQLVTLESSREQTLQVAYQSRTTGDPWLLGGRYRLEEVLGAGGFGRTYLAKDTQRPGQPTVVVKQLKPTQTTPKGLELARRLFNQEAETMERLKHEQIPQLLAYFEENQEFYLVQEFIDGVVLAEEFNTKPQFTEMQVLALLWDLLGVLHYIHRQKVIHRDIKPQNIIRRRETKKLVLIDFGAVKELSMGLTDEHGPKETVGIGSRGFAPPEQYAGRPRYSSDIYAVGMVAIQSLTGCYPDQFHEDFDTGLLRWRTSDIRVSDRLARVIDKMILANFVERYHSAAEVVADLKAILDDIRRVRGQPSRRKPS